MTTYGITPERLTHINAQRITAPITMDGDLTKPCWQAATRSPRFVDMVSGEPAYYDTRVACLYDDTHFYVGYWVEEPFVTATMTERDSFIWFDNDVESETAEFDIEDWSEEERAKLCNMLDNLDIGYRLEDGVLIAPIGAEQVIESCIDSIEEDLDGDDA